MKPKDRLGKRAGIFAVGMIITMIIVMAAAWQAFSTTNRKIAVGVEILPNLTSHYNEQDRFSIYIEESKSLAASQALYEIAKDAAIDKKKGSCRVEPQTNYFIWDNNCKPETLFIKQRFIQEFNKSLISFVKAYPKENLRPYYMNEFAEGSEEIINSAASPIKLESKAKSTFASYSLSHSVETSLTSTKTNLTEENIDLNFNGIYNKIVEEKTRCQTEQKEAEECSKALEAIEFDYWRADVERQGSYFIFRLKTKDFFFFQENNLENYKQIELNFIMEI